MRLLSILILAVTVLAVPAVAQNNIDGGQLGGEGPNAGNGWFGRDAIDRVCDRLGVERAADRYSIRFERSAAAGSFGLTLHDNPLFAGEGTPLGSLNVARTYHCPVSASLDLAYFDDETLDQMASFKRGVVSASMNTDSGSIYVVGLSTETVLNHDVALFRGINSFELHSVHSDPESAHSAADALARIIEASANDQWAQLGGAPPNVVPVAAGVFHPGWELTPSTPAPPPTFRQRPAPPANPPAGVEAACAKFIGDAPWNPSLPASNPPGGNDHRFQVVIVCEGCEGPGICTTQDPQWKVKLTSSEGFFARRSNFFWNAYVKTVNPRPPVRFPPPLSPLYGTWTVHVTWRLQFVQWVSKEYTYERGALWVERWGRDYFCSDSVCCCLG